MSPDEVKISLPEAETSSSYDLPQYDLIRIILVAFQIRLYRYISKLFSKDNEYMYVDRLCICLGSN